MANKITIEKSKDSMNQYEIRHNGELVGCAYEDGTFHFFRAYMYIRETGLSALIEVSRK